MELKKIKVAFIKFGGMSLGGTEKFLQTIAANLNCDKFEVDYYYCDTAPYVGSDYCHAGTDKRRLEYMKAHGVNVVEFKVERLDDTSRYYDWLGTDFWLKFDESKYDIIQAGRFGKPTYPFTKIRKTPIVDSLHILAGVDNQYNIARVLQISEWSAKKWIRMGGDASRVVLVSHPMEINYTGGDLRSELGLEGKFVFGFHQRNDDAIFSPWPLAAYKSIENSNTVFVLLGGGKAYRQQASELGLKNVIFLDHSGDIQRIYKFLATLNVYAHGRKDGEVNSTAMAEAMFFGLPIVSHISKINNGHVECIGAAGRVVDTLEQYCDELKKLKDNCAYWREISAKSRQQFIAKYDLNGQMNIIERVYQDVVSNPYPHKFTRFVSQFKLRYVFIYSFVRFFNWVRRKIEIN